MSFIVEMVCLNKRQTAACLNHTENDLNVCRLFESTWSWSVVHCELLPLSMYTFDMRRNIFFANMYLRNSSVGLITEGFAEWVAAFYGQFPLCKIHNSLDCRYTMWFHTCSGTSRQYCMLHFSCCSLYRTKQLLLEIDTLWLSGTFSCLRVSSKWYTSTEA